MRLFRLEDAWFEEDLRSGSMTGPYPDLATLFRTRGHVVASGSGGEVLEWEGLVVSRDDEGSVAGPYAGFDEWVWDQAELVSQERGPTGSCMSLGGRFIHHWRGMYFVTVDPLPVHNLSFPSLESAREELRTLAWMALGFQHG